MPKREDIESKPRKNNTQPFLFYIFTYSMHMLTMIGDVIDLNLLIQASLEIFHTPLQIIEVI